MFCISHLLNKTKEQTCNSLPLKLGERTCKTQKLGTIFIFLKTLSLLRQKDKAIYIYLYKDTKSVQAET